MQGGRVTAQVPRSWVEQVGCPRTPMGSARFVSPDLLQQKPGGPPLGPLSEGFVGHALSGCLAGGVHGAASVWGWGPLPVPTMPLGRGTWLWPESLPFPVLLRPLHQLVL